MIFWEFISHKTNFSIEWEIELKQKNCNSCYWLWEQLPMLPIHLLSWHVRYHVSRDSLHFITTLSWAFLNVAPCGTVRSGQPTARRRTTIQVIYLPSQSFGHFDRIKYCLPKRASVHFKGFNRRGWVRHRLPKQEVVHSLNHSLIHSIPQSFIHASMHFNHASYLRRRAGISW